MLDEKMKEYKEEFELKGYEKVKIELASGRYGNPENHSYPKACYAKMWLEEKEKTRQEVLKREEIAIAKEANQISKSTKNAAWLALIISVISILLSVFILFFKK